MLEMADWAKDEIGHPEREGRESYAKGAKEDKKEKKKKKSKGSETGWGAD
jgi:hypothetical protein